MRDPKLILVLLFLLISFGASYAAPQIPMQQPAAKSHYILTDFNNHVVVYDSEGVIVRDEASGTCVRTQWEKNYDECAPQIIRPEAKTEQKTRAVIAREDRTVYFGFNQASLSPEMQQRLNSLATALTFDNQVKGARIIGYADRIGNPGYNEKLSKKRAENVRKYLINKGLINTRVADTRWFGASMPETSCPDGMKRAELIDCLQKDRRVEVEIDYAADLRAAR